VRPMLDDADAARCEGRQELIAPHAAARAEPLVAGKKEDVGHEGAPALGSTPGAPADPSRRLT
jgi:hypothetical protein